MGMNDWIEWMNESDRKWSDFSLVLLFTLLHSFHSFVGLYLLLLLCHCWWWCCCFCCSIVQLGNESKSREDDWTLWIFLSRLYFPSIVKKLNIWKGEKKKRVIILIMFRVEQVYIHPFLQSHDKRRGKEEKKSFFVWEMWKEKQ